MTIYYYNENGIFHYLLDNIVQYKNITTISDLQNLLLIRH